MDFFLGAPWGKGHKKLTLVFLELQKNFFFLNRSEFCQEFIGIIREAVEAILEAVEAVFRNFLRGWGATNFFFLNFSLDL